MRKNPDRKMIFLKIRPAPSRHEIEAATAAYLKKGGKITPLPPTKDVRSFFVAPVFLRLEDAHD